MSGRCSTVDSSSMIVITCEIASDDRQHHICLHPQKKRCMNQRFFTSRAIMSNCPSHQEKRRRVLFDMFLQRERLFIFAELFYVLISIVRDPLVIDTQTYGVCVLNCGWHL